MTDYQPTTDSNKKKRSQKQQTIVELYGLYNGYKNKIAELEKQKSEALDLLAIYQRRLDTYKRVLGLTWATFTEKDGLYTFQDSTTFDILTQEFQFQPKSEKEAFEVRLIAIPESALSNSADEVMLHINLTDAKPYFDSRIQLEFNDVFASDSWELEKDLFTQKDSVALLEFFEGLLNKKTAFEIIARGQGIAKWNGVRAIKDDHPNELKSYPPNAKMDSNFVRLRRSELYVNLSRDITLEVNSYTDPVVSNIQIINPGIAELSQKYNLSKNDVLSAYRTATILKKLKREVNVLAGTYLTRSEAKIVIDRFNKEWSKTRISIGPNSIKLSEF